jgi:hypothetical protein
MRMGGLTVGGALVLLVMCLSPSPAAAAVELEPGVHVDPESPAAKEYVLPLSQARQTGATSSSKSGAAPLFGAGITPPGGGSGGSSSGASTSGHNARGGSHASQGKSGSRDGATAPASAPLPPGVLRATRAQGSSAGSGSLLALLGGGLAVLVLGAFGGTVLRHSRRPHGRRPTTSG